MELAEAITSREMRALELNAEYFGVSRLQLMENAGRAVAEEIALRFKPNGTRVAVFCGLGGNGGDGFVAARHLLSMGFQVKVILAGRSSDIVNEEAKANWKSLKSIEPLLSMLYEAPNPSMIPDVEADVVVDALLGFGARGRLRSPILELVQKINSLDAFRVAVDVPTGINADTGEVLGEAVKAHLTVTFHRAKPGLLKAKDYVGELVVRRIGIPGEVEAVAGPGDVWMVARPRPPESHKGDFGRLLIVGGSEVFSGAPALAALAALRTGVDITYIAAPHRTAYAISSMSPNLITVKLEGEHLNPRNIATIRRFIGMSDAVIIGPGLGLHPETREAVTKIIQAVEEAGLPLLLDADGLKAFAESKRKLSCPLVLTPHAGEYKLLTGNPPPTPLQERMEGVRRAAEGLGATILLKGHVDVISDGKRVKVNFTGNPGMTVGGTGDTLSGIVGALLAQGTPPFQAAVAGAFINGAAGDLVREEKGYHMVATDILDQIPRVMDDPMLHARLRSGNPP